MNLHFNNLPWSEPEQVWVMLGQPGCVCSLIGENASHSARQQHWGNVHPTAACRETAMLLRAAGRDLEREPGFGSGEGTGKHRCGKQAKGLSEPWRNPAVTCSGLLRSSAVKQAAKLFQIGRGIGNTGSFLPQVLCSAQMSADSLPSGCKVIPINKSSRP